MPSARHHSFGDSAIPWKDIVSYFRGLGENVASLLPMAELAKQLADSGYAADGLHGNTSMHTLMISQSRDITGNPHLRIEWNDREQEFRFTYEDGSLKPWRRVCHRSEVFEVLERFLVKRARWFRHPSRTNNGLIGPRD
jgi:hypothetical protein